MNRRFICASQAPLGGKLWKPLKESRGERVADQHLVEQYEQLRREATRGAGNGGQGLGLALFLRSGMAAWMQAWSQCVSGVRASAPSQAATVTSAPIDVRAQIATLLAGIILNLQQKVTHDSHRA